MPIDETAADPLVLTGKRVVLRPVRVQDYDVLRQAELGEELASLWRYQGATPSPEAYPQTLWAKVLAQFLVVERMQPTALGIVCVHDANFQHGFAHVSVAKFDPSTRGPNFIEGVRIFLNYVFHAWPLRKLYAYTNDRSLAQFRSGLGSVFIEEGRLSNHSFFGNRYWDEVILAVYREQWLEVDERLRHF